jgi:geranylgeranyl pyrophosphate synthase
VIAGADTPGVNAIDRYAAELGLAFQIIDDVLDVEGSAAQLGKSAGKDAAAAKPTYTSLFGVERSRQLAAECIDRALAAIDDARLTDGQLPAIARWIVDRTN